MNKYEIGVTAPPFHPWCRGTTAPYFEDMQDIGERWARDADGKSYEVPKSMTYKQWKAKQDELHGAGSVDKARKMSYNESADKKQFERYKELQLAGFPRRFADFQQLKYNNAEQWEQYKKIAQRKKLFATEIIL